MRVRVLIAMVIWLLAAGGIPVQAQSSHQGHVMNHGAGAGQQPILPGQDLFGAITEIVSILNADPATDWAAVDIAALQRHLLDMHLVATQARPVSAPVEDGLRVTLARPGPAGAAAERMLAAHGPILEAVFGWNAELETDAAEIRWRVRSPGNPADGAKIRALGFFGLLASGAHHQSHHLAMARGLGHPHVAAD